MSAIRIALHVGGLMLVHAGITLTIAVVLLLGYAAWQLLKEAF